MNSADSLIIIEAMQKAALAAARCALEESETPKFLTTKILTKPDGSQVTSADKIAQQTIRDELVGNPPVRSLSGATLLGEETSSAETPALPLPDATYAVIPDDRVTLLPEHRYRWVVDPIDGTHNFIRSCGYKQKIKNYKKYEDVNKRRWAVSIALQEEKPNGYETVAANVLVMNPDSTSDNISGILYTASETGPTHQATVLGGYCSNKRVVDPKKNVQFAGAFGRFNGEFPDPRGAENNRSIDKIITEALREAVVENTKDSDLDAARLLLDGQSRRRPTRFLDTVLDHDNRVKKHTAKPGTFHFHGVRCACADMLDILAEKSDFYVHGVHHIWDTAASFFLLQRAGVPAVEYVTWENQANRAESNSVVIAANSFLEMNALRDAYLDAADRTQQNPIKISPRPIELPQEPRKPFTPINSGWTMN